MLLGHIGMKSIIKSKKTISKETIQLRVMSDTASRLKNVRLKIKSLTNVDSGLDARIEEGILKCLDQAEKEIADFEASESKSESLEAQEA